MKQTNCPNCGATITGPKCEYCGTVFDDPETSIAKLREEIVLIQNAKLTEHLYEEALAAMKKYSGCRGSQTYILKGEEK